MVKTYVESIPRSLQEAAEIDGAGVLTVFFKVILPTSKTNTCNNSYLGCSRTVELISGYFDIHNRPEIILITVFIVYIHKSGKLTCFTC